ncbi:MAG: caspase family protein [Alphaproteobacteria bacterium]|nr:caspase family protein [Alphaproteobacteria bacterium]
MDATPRYRVMVRLAGLVGLCALILAFSDGALAERRLALVIGNGAYQVGPLENPTNDAGLMAETLISAGFDVTHLENLGYRDLQRAVVSFGRDLKAAGPDTVGMVFYAGHAVQADGENYLIPIDANIQDSLDLRITTLEVSTLMASLRAAGNRLNLVVLDACRNNPFPSMSRSGSRGLAKIEAAYGTLLAFSTAPGEVAADGSGRNSPYTAALARAIRTPGLAVEHVFKRVRVDVMERTGNQQVPWESSSLTGDFIFIDRPPEPVVAAPQAPAVPDNTAEIEYWKSVAASNDPAAIQTYLDAYPGGLFANLAQQRIQSLQTNQALAARTQHEAAARAAWDAVKDTDDPALLQSIVERYGDTVYAEVAQVKLDSLQQVSDAQAALDRAATQQAALPPPAAPPGPPPSDGRLLYQGKFIAQRNCYGGGTWCGGSSTFDMDIEIIGTAVTLKLRGHGTGLTLKTNLRDNRFVSTKYINGVSGSEAFFFSGTRINDEFRVEVTRGSTVPIFSGTAARVTPAATTAAAPGAGNSQQAELLFWESIKDSSNRADYQAYLDRFPNGVFTTIARDRAANGYAPQVAALSPTAAPPQHPLDGDWILTVETTIPNPQAQWCRWEEGVEEVVTFEDGNLDTRVKTNMGKSAQIKMSLSEGGASYFAKPQGWGQHLFYGDLDRQGDFYQAEIFITMSNARCKQTITLRRP